MWLDDADRAKVEERKRLLHVRVGLQGHCSYLEADHCALLSTVVGSSACPSSARILAGRNMVIIS